MISLEDLKQYLPKYLSEESLESMFVSLKDFPDNIHSRFYTTLLNDKEIIFQGDCMRSAPPLKNTEEKTTEIPVMIISNTCDNSHENIRLIELQLIYSPIVRISKIIDRYKNKGVKSERIDSFVETLKGQRITNMFYLPVGFGIKEESVVFFDRICSCENTYTSDNLSSLRVCSLSNYGFYLLIYKLSIHFTRMRERVDRDKGLILK